MNDRLGEQGLANLVTSLPGSDGSAERHRRVLALAMQSSRMGAWERDLVNGRVWWSEELEEMFGLERGSFGCTRENFHELMHADDRPIAAAEVEGAIRERRSFIYEFRFHHTDGSVRWMEGRGQAEYDSDGQPLRLYGVGIDITERKQDEARTRFLTELGQAVQPISDPSDIMSVTARMLGDHVAADRCAYAEIEDERIFVITGDHTRGVPSIVGRWDVAAFGTECTRQMLANEPYVVIDSEADPRIRPEDVAAYRATNIRGVILVPLHKNGAFTAAMAVHQSTPRRWTEAEIDLVRLVVARCWESLERARALRIIRESDERFRMALSSGAVTVYEQDIDLRYKWLYPSAPFSPGVIGKSDMELTGDEAGRHRTELKQRVIDTGRPVRGEVSALVGDVERWYDLMIEPRYDAGGNMTGVGGTALDITDKKVAEAERQKLERELTDSEARFRALMEQAPLSIQLFEPGGRHIQVNRAWEELWGTRLDDIPDYNILEDPQLEKLGIAKRIRRAFKGEAVELPAILYDPNETIPGGSDNPDPARWVSAIAYPLKAPDGSVREVALVHQDITARRKAEDEMSFQKMLLEALTESVLDGILIVSPSGEILHMNRRLIDIWHFPPEVLEQRSDTAALAWAAEQTVDPAGFLARISAMYEKGDGPAREEVMLKDGRVYERFGAAIYEGDTRLGWVWTFHDITVRKRALAEVQAARDELELRVTERTQELANANSQLRQQMHERERAEAERLDLLKRLFTIQEDERGRIARDIHDHLGQRVTALRLKTASIRDLCGDNPEICARLDRVDEIARQLDREVSFVAWELRPSILDDLEFKQAIDDYISEWSRHSEIPAVLHSSDLSQVPIDKDVEINLYRIVQEALNNTAKHAGAASVAVLLERRGRDLVMIIEDDGKGFDPDKTTADMGQGFGLRGMRERASLIGGSLEIESGTGTGTAILIRVPLCEAKKRRAPALTVSPAIEGTEN